MTRQPPTSAVTQVLVLLLKLVLGRDLLAVPQRLLQLHDGGGRLARGALLGLRGRGVGARLEQHRVAVRALLRRCVAARLKLRLRRVAPANATACEGGYRKALI